MVKLVIYPRGIAKILVEKENRPENILAIGAIRIECEKTKAMAADAPVVRLLATCIPRIRRNAATCEIID